MVVSCAFVGRGVCVVFILIPYKAFKVNKGTFI